MQCNFLPCLDVVLRHEGGYADHPDDPGGATKYGITIRTLSEWRGTNCTKDDVRALTMPQAAEIYRAGYWRRIRGDDLPMGVDLTVFDYAVNSGVNRALKALQIAVEVKADGVIGPVTMAAIAAHAPRSIIISVNKRRLSFLERLAHWPTFRRGWTRRVNETRSQSLEMV